jgi:hypothetical protein
MLISLTGCRSTQEIQRTPEEVEFGKESVLEMMDLVVLAASDTIANTERWKSVTAQLVPTAASGIFTIIDTIPGTQRLMDTYLLRTYEAMASMGSQIPRFFREELKPTIEIKDPFAIIEGNNDAITRHFASHLAPRLESWIVQRLSQEDGIAVVGAWDALLLHYNTYVKAQNQLNKKQEDLQLQTIDVTIEQTVMISFLREFIAAMTTQEALLRTMAPAYDDPRITIFSTP